ncbi:MAG: hypothetical protein WC712_13315 [Candidatus Brocadiia bacterium]
MKSRLLVFALIPLMSLMLFVSSVATNVGAEDVTYDVPDSEGWLGIYVAGEKLGYIHWKIERKKVDKEEYYRITANEARTIKIKKDGKDTGKEAKETYTYNATVKMDLSPRTLEYTGVKGGQKATLNATRKDTVIEVEATLGDGPKMPVQKVNMKPDTTWAFCSALVFGWRRHSIERPSEYSRMIEASRVVLSSEMVGAEKKITFEGEELDGNEWSAEGGKVVLAYSDGRLLTSVETTKTGVETKYICEAKDVAESMMNYEQKKAKDASKPNTGKNNKDPKKPGKGDHFKDALDPVGEDEADSAGPEYLKLPLKGGTKFSMRAAKGWKCVVTKNGNNFLILVVNEEDNNVLVNVLIQATDGKDPSEMLDEFIEASKNQEGVDKLEVDEGPDEFDLGKCNCAGALVSFIANNEKRKAYCVFMGGDELTVLLLPSCTDDAWKGVEADMYSMFGSARYE